MKPFESPFHRPTPIVGFVLVPADWFAWGDEEFRRWQFALLQRAFEEAQAAAHASWLESDPLGRWN
jgi:hypothetical protein